ncbi:MAG: PilZ domain-containing protein [Gammaproteobacteria bacterium]
MAIDYDTPEYAGDFILEPLGTPRSQQVETTLLVDLRRHPRFDTRLHAEISVGNGNRANGIITNISRTGLRLEGGRHMVDAIVPGHNMRSEHSPVSLELQFSLPGGKEQAAEITVRCKTVYVLSEVQNSYQIGIVFTDFDAGEKALARYLEARVSRR